MDVYGIITEKIITLLEQGVVPWRRPWTATGLPRNLVSVKPYRGADGDAKTPGVNNGAKVLELVAPGVGPEPARAPMFTAVDIGISTALNTEAPRIDPETKDAIETAIMAL